MSPIRALPPLENVEIALQRFTNASGIITVEADAPHIPGEGNGLLQTGLWYCIKAQYAPLSDKDTVAVAEITRQCKHQSKPLLWRSPFKQNPDDDNNHDDYRGWLAACFHAGVGSFLISFLAYAESNDWFIDVQQPESRRLAYWFGRFIDFPPFARACVGVTARAFDASRFAGSILFSSLFSLEKSDALIRDYCMISVMRKSSALVRLASKVWFWRVRKKYVITGQAFAGYFKSKLHPLCVGDWP